ncbi:MAG: phasin family protein [Flavobacteriales bacterium]
MEDILKKLIYQGLGVVSVTRDRAEKLIAELVEKGKMTEDEGRKFYEELASEGKKTADDLGQGVRDFIREQIEKAGIPSRDEFEALKLRVVELEAQIKETQP